MSSSVSLENLSGDLPLFTTNPFDLFNCAISARSQLPFSACWSSGSSACDFAASPSCTVSIYFQLLSYAPEQIAGPKAISLSGASRLPPQMLVDRRIDVRLISRKNQTPFNGVTPLLTLSTWFLILYPPKALAPRQLKVVNKRTKSSLV